MYIIWLLKQKNNDIKKQQHLKCQKIITKKNQILVLYKHLIFNFMTW